MGLKRSALGLLVLQLFGLFRCGFSATVTSSAFDNCRTGAYAVTSPPFGPCSGFRPCEPGFYCTNEMRYSCPAGTYGATESLSNSSCSGTCQAGYWCPPESTSSTSRKCGNVTVYCPTGSSIPLAVPAGYYSVSSDGSDMLDLGLVHDEHDEDLRSGVVECPQGWYCPGQNDAAGQASGRRVHCPGGTFRTSVGATSAEDCTTCPAGYFCPIGSTEPFQHPCGKDPSRYCPEGSALPEPTEVGYYAGGNVEYRDGLTTDSHASISNSYSSELGELAGYSSSHVCEAGYYCIGGARMPCPGGTYGSTKQQTNSTCTGECTEGWYCPVGSVSPYEHACGDSSVYCPHASAAPIRVSPGYYTSSQFHNATAYADMPEGENHQGLRHTAQTLCEPGYYCLTDGIRYACPPGRFGSITGLTSTSCSGSCQAGYYCGWASTKPNQEACGYINLFCPEGSATPHSVGEGYYTINGDGARDDYYGDVRTRSWERMCEPGYYCSNGEKFMCEAGHYSGRYRETQSTCEGGCLEGYYCPEGSTTNTEVMCGDPSRYCPGNTSRPIEVDIGYYTQGGTISTRLNQTIAPLGHYAVKGLLYACPAGYYGDEEGLSDATCSGQCLVEGFYCGIASISPYQALCGDDDHYCPAGSRVPLHVKDGYYTADYEYEECEPGKFRQDSYYWTDVSLPGPSDVVTETADPGCTLCADGKFKAVVGDNNTLCLDCPMYSVSADDRVTCVCEEVVAAGTFKYFNVTAGTCDTLADSVAPLLTHRDWANKVAPGNSSLTRSSEKECEPGHYCIAGKRYRCPAGRYGALRREQSPLCQGMCKPGYYCEQSSISPYSHPCGSAHKICSEGSPTPVTVPPGFYSNEDAREDLRSYLIVCPSGMYCPGDGRRYDCPAGRYGLGTGESNELCSDVCARGHYCTAGSSMPKQYTCGNATVYCPRGSSAPTPVTPGFYAEFSGPDAGAQRLWDSENSTCSIELLCEPGYYCQNGVKYPCPPGTFGWRYGATEATCGGKCAAGYYCPSYLAPQPDAPAHTQWPAAPHTTATPYQCGGVSFLCPKGSFYPVLVGGGNYTVGGTADNLTRTGQEVCLPGTFCSDGIVNLCPKGRYGSKSGSSVATCTGWCPSGHYCPAGTSEPFPCAEGYYATGASWNCSACPGERETPLLCKTGRECCFRG